MRNTSEIIIVRKHGNTGGEPHHTFTPKEVIRIITFIQIFQKPTQSYCLVEYQVIRNTIYNSYHPAHQKRQCILNTLKLMQHQRLDLRLKQLFIVCGDDTFLTLS